MKKKILTLVLGVTLLLTACGANLNFKVASSDLEKYAEDNSGIYYDVTEDYELYSEIEGVYIIDTANAHVELWDFDSTESAKQWFSENLEIMKDKSSSNVGSYSKTSGDYSFKGDTVNRLLFCDDCGIWAEGPSADDIEEVLKDLSIVK